MRKNVIAVLIALVMAASGSTGAVRAMASEATVNEDEQVQDKMDMDAEDEVDEHSIDEGASEEESVQLTDEKAEHEAEEITEGTEEKEEQESEEEELTVIEEAAVEDVAAEEETTTEEETVGYDIKKEEETVEQKDIGVKESEVKDSSTLEKESASTNVAASGSCGDYATWTLSSDGTLTISGSGEMYDYKKLSPDSRYSYFGSEDYAPWIQNGDLRRSIERIIVNEGIEYIGAGAFEFAGSADQIENGYLTEIRLPSSLKKIGRSAFAGTGCPLLLLGTEGNDLEIDTLAVFQFSGFDKIIIKGTIDSLAGFIHSDVKEVEIGKDVNKIATSAFRDCKELYKVTISNGVTEIAGNAFDGCSSLENIIIPDSVTEIGEYAFNNSGLKSIEFGSGLTEISEGCFYNCSELESISIPRNIGCIRKEAFFHCENLNSVKMSDDVTTIESRAFVGCSQLSDVYLSKSLNRIESGTFGSCTSIESITIPDNVEFIGDNAFAACSMLTEITLPKNLKRIGGDPYKLGAEDGGVFRHCDSLTSVTLPSSVETIGAYAFLNSDSIETIYYMGTESQWGDIEQLTLAIPEDIDIYYSITACNIRIPNTYYVYDGVAKHPTVTVKDDGTTLRKGTHYKVTYSNNINAGTASITITGIGQYFGSVKKSFSIEPKDIVPVVTLNKKSFVYNGAAQRPTVTVKDEDTALTADDYTVTWPSGSTEVGTYNVIVTLKGNYSGTASAIYEIKTPWQKIDGVTYYLDANGNRVTGWQTIDGEKYYFDTNGAMHIGWLQLGDKWYYFRVTGAMHTGMLKKDGIYYYLEKSGVRHSGWLQVSGKLYYFKLNGQMLTGWLQVKGKKYYFKTNGQMLTGWLQKSGKKYYFKTNGQMHTGWLKLGGKYYYFKENGQMVTGRYKIGGKWYTFSSNGIRQ